MEVTVTDTPILAFDTIIKKHPCPFCGGIDLKWKYSFKKSTWRVQCRDCGGLGGRGLTQEEANNLWNKRTKRKNT